MKLQANTLSKLAAGLLFTLWSLASAATLTVSTTDDQLEDIGNVINDCSLREAIVSVNEGKNMFGCTAVGTFGSNDRIVLPAGTYALKHLSSFAPDQDVGNLNIHRAVSITGAGASSTIIDGTAVQRDGPCGGVLRVDDGNDNTTLTVALSNLTIQQGLAGLVGGGGSCPHTIVGGQNAGGGIYNREALTLLRVTVRDNEAEDGSGGGIFSDGRLELLDSTVSGNVAGEAGGGVLNFFGGELLIEQSTVSGNASLQAGVEYAGGVHNLGATTLRTSTISGNTTGARGGGIVNGQGSGPMTILFSTISGNGAPDFSGGGILQSSDSTLTIMNSTISGNTTGASGGGIFAESGVVALSNVTLTNNTADGGAGPGLGGGLRAVDSADVRVENSLIASNRDASGTAHPDCSGSFDSFGFNLIGDASGCSGFTRVSDRRGAPQPVRSSRCWNRSAAMVAPPGRTRFSSEAPPSTPAGSRSRPPTCWSTSAAPADPRMATATATPASTSELSNSSPVSIPPPTSV